ncbi:unnamed protein product, partial [Gulo gulo]
LLSGICEHQQRSHALLEGTPAPQEGPWSHLLPHCSNRSLCGTVLRTLGLCAEQPCVSGQRSHVRSPAQDCGTCVELCSGDWDCDLGESCVSNGCGHVCAAV